MDRSLINRLSRNITLLTVGNPKIAKSLGEGYATAGLSLAPAWESGHNTCPNHSTACSAACLNKAGRGAMRNVQEARIRRTKMFFEARGHFIDHLNADIYQFCKNARELGMKVALRLNILSDIRWEREGIMKRWPDIQFYDYTKIPNRKNLPSNYKLTFSFSGNNLDACRKALANGMGVAVPFLDILPETWLGHKVIDGDANDLRFLDPTPCIVGLRAKGPLRKLPQSPFLGNNHAV
jgi:hypothetical protein